MQNIPKLCADRLRFFSKVHSIKLKASHAHELVAAILGYNTKIALLADKQFPLSNLCHSKIIVQPGVAFIDQRRKTLQGLPPDLPDSDTLTKVVYDCLKSEKLIVNEIWAYNDLEKRAILLAQEFHHQKQLTKVYHAPLHEKVAVENTHEGILMTITRYHPVSGYRADGSRRNQLTSILTTIRLKRIAGHIGYAKPEINARPIPMLVKVQE